MKKYSKEELQQDFKLLKKCICEEHPLAFTDRNKVLAEFEQAEAGIRDGMTEEEFYYLVNPCVTAAGCGHTNLAVSTALIEARKETALYFPVEVIIDSGKLLVRQDRPEYGLYEGDRILGINGRSAEGILSSLERNISHDGSNPALAWYLAGKHFGYEYYEFADKSGVFRTEVLRGDNTRDIITIEGKYIPRHNTAAWQLHAPENIAPYECGREGKEAFLVIRVFSEGEQSFEQFLAGFFAELREAGADRLTIDLRGNFGGYLGMARELLSYLTEREIPYFTRDTKLPEVCGLSEMGGNILPKENCFKGDITLLTDGGCFSTSGHFAAVFKENHLGRILGSTTGGGAACTDFSADAVLENTGLRLHYSRALFAVQADESMRNGVEPDGV